MLAAKKSKKKKNVNCNHRECEKAFVQSKQGFKLKNKNSEALKISRLIKEIEGKKKLTLLNWLQS